MISLYFRNPSPPKPHYNSYNRYPIVHTPPTTVAAQPSTVIQTPQQTMLGIALQRASKLGITTIEWQRRDDIVRKLYSDSLPKWKFMDEFYPSSLEWYNRYGKCVYIGAVYSYAEIDHTPWPDDDSVMIFSARPLEPKEPKDAVQFICNGHFMSKELPNV